MASIKSLNQTGNPITNSASTENTNKPLEVDSPNNNCVLLRCSLRKRDRSTPTRTSGEDKRGRPSHHKCTLLFKNRLGWQFWMHSLNWLLTFPYWRRHWPFTSVMFFLYFIFLLVFLCYIAVIEIDVVCLSLSHFSALKVAVEYGEEYVVGEMWCKVRELMTPTRAKVRGEDTCFFSLSCQFEFYSLSLQ